MDFTIRNYSSFDLPLKIQQVSETALLAVGAVTATSDKRPNPQTVKTPGTINEMKLKLHNHFSRSRYPG